MKNKKSNLLGIISLAAGILALVLSLIPRFIISSWFHTFAGSIERTLLVIGQVFPILGVVLAVKQREKFPNKLASIALVINIIAIVLFLIMVIGGLVIGSLAIKTSIPLINP